MADNDDLVLHESFLPNHDPMDVNHRFILARLFEIQTRLSTKAINGWLNNPQAVVFELENLIRKYDKHPSSMDLKASGPGVMNETREFTLEDLTAAPPEDYVYDSVASQFKSIGDQIDAWQKINTEFRLGISQNDFWEAGRLAEIPLSEYDREQKFCGVAVFYGFTKPGDEFADQILSGRKILECFWRRSPSKLIYDRQFDFTNSKIMTFYNKSKPRPKGFYLAKVQLGLKYKGDSVHHAREYVLPRIRETCMASEGLQFFIVTHPHLLNMMDGQAFPFIDLGDYKTAVKADAEYTGAPYLCYNRDTEMLVVKVAAVSQSSPDRGAGTIQIL